MTDRPLVSIITPSFNQGAYLEQSMLSVLGQRYSPIEYIVIDGASTDDSPQIIRRYADRLAYWESVPDRGQAQAINKGLARARGEILGWLNADDILLADIVERVVAAFARDEHLDVVYGRLQRIDENGKLLPTPELPKDRVTFGRELVLGECVVNQPGSFWRRRAMEAAGMLDEDLQYTMDFDYWIRLALSGACFLRLAEPVAQFRLSRGSKTVSQTAAMAEEQLQVLERVMRIDDLSGKTGLTAQQLASRARKTRSRILLHACYGYFKTGRGRAALKRLAWALWEDPFCVFDARWGALLLARLKR